MKTHYVVFKTETGQITHTGVTDHATIAGKIDAVKAMDGLMLRQLREEEVGALNLDVLTSDYRVDVDTPGSPVIARPEMQCEISPAFVTEGEAATLSGLPSYSKIIIDGDRVISNGADTAITKTMPNAGPRSVVVHRMPYKDKVFNVMVYTKVEANQKRVENYLRGSSIFKQIRQMAIEDAVAWFSGLSGEERAELNKDLFMHAYYQLHKNGHMRL